MAAGLPGAGKLGLERPRFRSRLEGGCLKSGGYIGIMEKRMKTTIITIGYTLGLLSS